MESDICRLIFVHSEESLGESDQWRAEDKVVHLSLLSTKWSDISYFPSSHIRRTDCSDSLQPGLWFRFLDFFLQDKKRFPAAEVALVTPRGGLLAQGGLSGEPASPGADGAGLPPLRYLLGARLRRTTLAGPTPTRCPHGSPSLGCHKDGERGRQSSRPPCAPALACRPGPG